MDNLKLESSSDITLAQMFPYAFLHWVCQWFDDDVKSHIITVIIEKEEDLKNNWNNIDSVVASHYQTNFESEFEKWNLYLIFFLSNPVKKSLKYKIENDKYSSRKIVIDNFSFKNEQEYIIEIEKVIRTRVLNSDLLLESIPKEDNSELKLSKEILKIVEAYSLEPKSDKAENIKERQSAYIKLLKQFGYEI